MTIHFLSIILTIWLCTFDTNCKFISTYSPLSNDPKPASSIIRQRIMENKKPNVTTIFFGGNENHTDAKIKVDTLNGVIFVLTLMEDERKTLLNSSLYYFSTTEPSLKTVNLVYNNQFIQFTEIFAFPGLVLAYSAKNIICLSFTGGKTWNIIPSSIRVKEAYFYPNDKLLAITDLDDKLYQFVAENRSFFVITQQATHIKWHPHKPHLYHIANSFVRNRELLSFEADSRALTWKSDDIDSYGFYDNTFWMFQKRVSGTEFVLEVNGKDKQADFPKYVQLEDILVIGTSKHELFVVIQNRTNNFLTYSAWLADLKFSKIIISFGIHERSDGKFCAEVEVFDAFPGLMIANIHSESDATHELFTAISFNHGVKWTHLRGPREVSSLPCSWPKCYLRLNLRCYRDGEQSSIKFNEHNPSLMVSSGSIYNGTRLEQSGFFLSTNAGFVWKMAPVSLANIEILNGGALLVGIQKIPTIMLYSLDLGNIWKSVSLFPLLASPRAGFTVVVSGSLTVKTISFDNSLKKWILVSVDFEKLIEKECDSSDFENFTPGHHAHLECFQGSKNVIQRKKPNVTCRVNEKKLTYLKTLSCSCTEDDFGCSFGYFSENGRCYSDSDAETDTFGKDCELGDFLLHKSKIRMVPDDHCTATENWKDEQLDICGLTHIDKGVTILVGSTIKYVSFTKNPDEKITTIPFSISQHGFIKEYAFDLTERCLYILNRTGVVEVCYHKRNVAYTGDANMFLRDASIAGFAIDEYANNMYYFNSTTISVIHIGTKQRLTLCTFELLDVHNINIIPELGFIIVVVSEQNTKENNVYFMLMNGTLLRVLYFSETVTLLTFDDVHKEHVLFTETSSYRLKSIEHPLMEEKQLYRSGILDVFITGNKTFYVTKGGIIMKDKFYHISQIKAGHFHMRTAQGKKHSCSLAPCRTLCVPVSSTEFDCKCPDGMLYNNREGKCECDPPTSYCSRCRNGEFNCDWGKCIDLRSRCDGVNHCNDASDESDCNLFCDMDEILCDHDTVCVEITKICDGVEHCKDGKDELNCHQVNKCKRDQFMCLDMNCISKEKHCDGINDCKDLTDEIGCDETCKYFEAKCDNGQCILPSQVCDNNFDCVDLSDERGCKKETPYIGNASCLVICENKCIPNTLVCDHITHCANGFDEIDCEHKVTCDEPDSLACKSEFLCFSKSKICDGFTDCSDQSDERNCKDLSLCGNEYSFTCNTTDSCISMNNYCDGVEDCPDMSDESGDCKNKRFVRSVIPKNLYHGKMKFMFTVVGNSSHNDRFDISVISNDGRKSFYTEERYITIDGLNDCDRYTVTVKFVGEKYGRYRQFIYHDSIITKPENVTYNYSSNTLYWIHNRPSCHPVVFYIQCVDDKRLVYQNFTETVRHHLSFHSRLICRVAACPIYVYNVSCSDFSPDLHLKHYSSYHNAIIAFVLITITASLISVICFFYFKKSPNIAETLRASKAHLVVLSKRIFSTYPKTTCKSKMSSTTMSYASYYVLKKSPVERRLNL